jgi:hypothetical protein
MMMVVVIGRKAFMGAVPVVHVDVVVGVVVGVDVVVVDKGMPLKTTFTQGRSPLTIMMHLKQPLTSKTSRTKT